MGNLGANSTPILIGGVRKDRVNKSMVNNALMFQTMSSELNVHKYLDERIEFPAVLTKVGCENFDKPIASNYLRHTCQCVFIYDLFIIVDVLKYLIE
jgi:hypothetical protein